MRRACPVLYRPNGWKAGRFEGVICHLLHPEHWGESRACPSQNGVSCPACVLYAPFELNIWEAKGVKCPLCVCDGGWSDPTPGAITRDVTALPSTAALQAVHGAWAGATTPCPPLVIPPALMSGRCPPWGGGMVTK